MQVMIAVPSLDIQLTLDPEQLFPEGANLAEISDGDVIQAVANYTDQPAVLDAHLVVSRPATGNILISPKPQFGA